MPADLFATTPGGGDVLTDSTLIHRSVYTRGFYARPHFDRAAIGLLLDTQVTFRRYTYVDVGAGDMEPMDGPEPAALWTTLAFVDLDDEAIRRMPTIEGGGMDVARRRYIVITETPVDPAMRPQRDDWMDFTDAKGLAIRIKIERVDIAQNLPDYLEMVGDWFE